jgi:ribosomal protein L7Ae-like RNA K-turn-binding protein
MKTGKIHGLLGLASRARSVLIGSRETRAGLRRGEVRLVLLATDGSVRDRERMLRVTAEAGVPVVSWGTREELGWGVGAGPVAVMGLTDPALAGEVAARLAAQEPTTGSARAKNGGLEDVEQER